MNVLIDISHPAHVHFYRHLRSRFLSAGAEVLVIARTKDVTVDLLRSFEIPHLVSGRSGHRGWGGQLAEMITRDAFLIRHGRSFRPDVVLTRNPTGTHAARAIGAIGVFDTDDGRSVGIHYRAAAPFAHVITAPDCLPESFGRKERRYPSYKSLAYLHPDVFRPNSDIRSELGLSQDERYSVVRLVAHDASHDRHARGIDSEARARVIELLEAWGPVFVSGEAELPKPLLDRRLRVDPVRIHDVLAEAAIVVGDSQTIATEAALLATPSIRINTWANASPHITELEQRYGLVFSYLPEQIDEAMVRIDQLLADGGTANEWVANRNRMLEDKVDLTSWYFDLVTELAARPQKK